MTNEAHIVLRWRPLFGGQARNGHGQEYAVPIGPQFDSEDEARAIDSLPPLPGRFTVQRVLRSVDKVNA